MAVLALYRPAILGCKICDSIILSSRSHPEMIRDEIDEKLTIRLLKVSTSYDYVIDGLSPTK